MKAFAQAFLERLAEVKGAEPLACGASNNASAAQEGRKKAAAPQRKALSISPSPLPVRAKSAGVIIFFV